MTAPGGAPLRSTARASVGRAHRKVLAAAQRLDPSRLLLRRAVPPSPVSFVCIYRRRNTEVVRALLAQLPPGSEARLWSLDAVPDALAAQTVGHGAGLRTTLLNRLVRHVPLADRPLVLSDDDVRFVIGDVGRLVEVGRALGLDLYQPAHLASSYASWEFVRRQRLTLARVTGFVEQGPLLVLSPAGRGVVLPLPEDIGMAWGVEARWADRAGRDGLRMGIVDAVAVRHLAPPAGGYDRQVEEVVLRDEVRRAGLEGLDDLHVVHDRVGLRDALFRRV